MDYQWEDQQTVTGDVEYAEIVIYMVAVKIGDTGKARIKDLVNKKREIYIYSLGNLQDSLFL